MSLIMEAWRERGYAPPGSERMLQDYEDKLELERNKQDLIYALKYPPAPPPPPPPSPEDTRNEIYARLYPPSNGPAPPPELEDLSDGTLGVAGDVHAIRRVLDASGVEHYLPFRHNSIVIGLPDVAKARNALAGVRWGGDAEAKADEESGIGAGAASTGTARQTESAGSNQGWEAGPVGGAAAYVQPNALSRQAAQPTRPAWADHIAGIDTPTLEGILAQRYVMQLRGGGTGVYGSEVSRRTGKDMGSDPATYVGGVQNLSNRDSVGGRYAGAQLAASSAAGHAEPPAVPGSVNPGAIAPPGQAFLDGVAESLRESRGRGPTRASQYRDFVVSGKFGKLSVADQRVVLAALDSHANELTEGSMANGADAKAADAAVRYAADQARAAGAIDDRTRFAAEARVGATVAMAWLQPAIRRGQGAVKIAEEKSNGYLPGFKEADILSVEKGLRPRPTFLQNILKATFHSSMREPADLCAKINLKGMELGSVMGRLSWCQSLMLMIS